MPKTSSREQAEPLTTFRDLGVLPEIADALDRAGISTPFPIQEMTLSVAMLGTDLIGQARTGTGKTLAFGIPLLHRVVVEHDPEYVELVAPGKPQALVVAPTRELALQVASDLKVASADRGTRVLTVYGGVGYEPQLEALNSGVDVVVGTPGRLLDLFSKKALDLSHVKVLVLDEADEMLDLGFLPDVERLLAGTPSSRQTMLFSATMPGAVITLARTHMRHPVNIRAESSHEESTVPTTAQFIYQVHDLDKPEIIARVLQSENCALTIVFTKTKRAAQRLTDDLIERGFDAAPLHGDMAQVAREKALKRFREGKVKVLVATDVAARGIDVTDVTHVINHACPEDDSTYVHRIGRTGRAGASGTAITFVDWADVTRWKVINKALKLPFDEPVETYSTSAHLFHDLGIPQEVTGRIAAPTPAPAREPSEPRERPARPPRNRNRTRSRAGQPVAGEASAASTSMQDSSVQGGQKSTPPSGSTESDGVARKPRRRRRRPAGSGNQGTDSVASQQNLTTST